MHSSLFALDAGFGIVCIATMRYCSTALLFDRGKGNKFTENIRLIALR